MLIISLMRLFPYHFNPIAVQRNNEPASKLTVEGSPMCNLAEHRVTAGCTAVVALRVGKKLFVANAGDSRGVLSRAGKAIALSEDHKPQSEVETNRITRVSEEYMHTCIFVCIYIFKCILCECLYFFK